MKTATKHTATRTWPETAWTTDMEFSPKVISAGEMRGHMETRDPWQSISKYEAIAMEHIASDETHFSHYPDKAVLHGVRSLLNPRESGHVLEGTVSIDGKKRRAFTSSALFLVNGKLVDVAILYVCK